MEDEPANASAGGGGDDENDDEYDDDQNQDHDEELTQSSPCEKHNAPLIYETNPDRARKAGHHALADELEDQKRAAAVAAQKKRRREEMNSAIGTKSSPNALKGARRVMEIHKAASLPMKPRSIFSLDRHDSGRHTAAAAAAAAALAEVEAAVEAEAAAAALRAPPSTATAVVSSAVVALPLRPARITDLRKRKKQRSPARPSRRRRRRSVGPLRGLRRRRRWRRRWWRRRPRRRAGGRRIVHAGDGFKQPGREGATVSSGAGRRTSLLSLEVLAATRGPSPGPAEGRDARRMLCSRHLREDSEAEDTMRREGVIVVDGAAAEVAAGGGAEQQKKGGAERRRRGGI